jgi:hypothetical protein
MPTIRFSAAATVFDFKHEDANDEHTPVIEDPRVLVTLDGIESDEIFSDYLSDGGDKTLANAGVSGGQLRFRFDKEAGKLYGVTEYSLVRALTADEEALLREYTIGQWSDGIGDNFCQERMEIGLAPQLFIMDSDDVLIQKSS